MIKFKPIIPKKEAIERDIKKALKSMEKETNEKLEQLTCPEHHEHPYVVFSGSIKNPNFEIKGCCQQMVEEAKRILE